MYVSIATGAFATFVSSVRKRNEVTDQPRRRQKLTYLVEPRLDRREALALLREIQELGVELDGVSRTPTWTKVMTLEDGTVISLSERWTLEETVSPTPMRLASEFGNKVAPLAPDVLAARAEAEEAVAEITRLRRASSGE